MATRNFKEFDNISLWYEDHDDVLFFTYTPHIEIDISVAKALVKNRLDYAGNKDVYVIVDINNIKSVTKEAREYMSQPENGLKGILAGAFISNKPLTTVVINFFLTINKPSVPAKFFTNKDDALSWIKKIKEK